MAKKRIYEPMEKVIVTLDDTARIGYVVAMRKNGSTGYYGDGKWQVRVAYTLEDAREHRFKLISHDYVLPYQEEMWQAFERLFKRREELAEWFQSMRQGRIPIELQPFVQAELFTQKST